MVGKSITISRRYLESGNIEDCRVGGGPFIIDRESGGIVEGGCAHHAIGYDHYTESYSAMKRSHIRIRSKLPLPQALEAQGFESGYVFELIAPRVSRSFSVHRNRGELIVRTVHDTDPVDEEVERDLLLLPQTFNHPVRMKLTASEARAMVGGYLTERLSGYLGGDLVPIGAVPGWFGWLILAANRDARPEETHMVILADDGGIHYCGKPPPALKARLPRLLADAGRYSSRHIGAR